MIRSVQAKTIKSAERVLSVLEYFNTERDEATVTDIVRAYGLPQSSTWELLRCLASLGYLAYDPRRRTFRPTARVALLGADVLPNLFRYGNLLAMVDELNQRTGEAIVVGMPVGLSVRYVHVVQATAPGRPVVAQGADRPLMHSAMGRVMLASMSDEQVRRLIHRLNAEGESQQRVTFGEISDELRKIRIEGHAMMRDDLASEQDMVAMLLPNCNGQPLSIGICGPSAALGERGPELAALLGAAFGRHLSPQPLTRTAA